MLVFDSPNSTLEDFDSAKGVVVQKHLIRFEKGSHDYFELVLETRENRDFFIREPEEELLAGYHQRIPRGVDVVIHFKKQSGRDLIVNLSAAGESIIELDDHLAKGAEKRRTIGLVSWIFIGIGAVFFVIYRIELTRAEKNGVDAENRT